MPTKSELQRLLEEFQRHVAQQAAKLAEQAELIESQQSTIAALTKPSRTLKRLKTAAAEAGVSYEAARRFCDRGLLASAQKQGGLWFCDAKELRAVFAQRVPPADQQRKLSF
jgi:hypothetical protein